MLPLSPADLTPVNRPDYHWSPANQRAFLEHLAIVGSVTQAARHVGMSARAAYDLKLRREGAAFKLGWAAAVLIARGRLGDDLLERAIHGYDEEYIRTPPDENGEVRILRHRTDSKLGMEYLKRLDRMVDTAAENAGELQLAQIIMGDWEAFLDKLAPVGDDAQGLGGGVAAVACYLAARDNRANPLAGLWENTAEDCEVAENSAVLGDAVEGATEEEIDPETAAARMHVWYCDYLNGWRTDFPPPTDFCGEEDLEFGDAGYSRELSDEEEEVRLARAEVEIKPLRTAGEAARLAWFGLGAGKGSTQRRGDAVEPGQESTQTKTPCHPRECGDPWSEGELNNEPFEVLGGQTMDSRLRGNDNGLVHKVDALSATTVQIEPEKTEPTPPDDPNIRVIHCRPQPNYAALGKIPPWAQPIY